MGILFLTIQVFVLKQSLRRPGNTIDYERSPRLYHDLSIAYLLDAFPPDFDKFKPVGLPAKFCLGRPCLHIVKSGPCSSCVRVVCLGSFRAFVSVQFSLREAELVKQTSEQGPDDRTTCNGW